MAVIKKTIGYLRKKKTSYNLVFPENLTTTMNQNFLMLARQGTGKTNLYMNIIYSLIKAYLEEESHFGAIPIVFSPLFEFTQMNLPSKNENLAPSQNPEGIECLQFTFRIANPPPDSDVRILGIDFRELTQEDICAFAGFSGDLKILGSVQKLLMKLRLEKPEYTIDDFLDWVWEEKPLKDALYYVFSKLRDDGFFDEDLEKIDWMTWLKERKPIIFNFGEIDDKFIYNSITGILLSGLWKVSNKFYNAYLKYQRLKNKKANGGVINEKDKLTEDEAFLLENFTIALLFDEAHQIFHATKSTELKYFPAHSYYKKISDLMGRKRGFKYNFLITQKCMELYYGFRKSFTALYVGSVIFQNDKEYMITELGISKDNVGAICRLNKYEWAVVNLDKYSSRVAKCVSKFKAYLSPCGQAQ
jgi:hypothetical protein